VDVGEAVFVGIIGDILSAWPEGMDALPVRYEVEPFYNKISSKSG
jgi:hypothetical protein